MRIGEPSSLFRHTWTIARWVEGEPADHAPITRVDAADALARFLLALHQEAPADAPANLDRGVPLAGLHDGDGGRLDVIADHPGADRARTVWHTAVTAPTWQGPPLWSHGDLHPANVVVRDGTLAGVVDFGELCAGDPATDLSAAWILLPAGAADRFFDAYAQADEATIARARGWAVLRAVGLIAIGRNGRLGLPGGKPTWEPAGHATLDRVLAAPSGNSTAVRRTWHARLLVEFSHFVLFDFSGRASPGNLLRNTDSRWVGASGPGGAVFHATDSNLEADVVVELHDTDPGPADPGDYAYTGGFRTDSGNLLLAAVTGSPSDTTVDLPHPGDYRLRAHRLPEPVDTSFGDRARCEQWVVRVWPA